MDLWATEVLESRVLLSGHGVSHAHRRGHVRHVGAMGLAAAIVQPVLKVSAGANGAFMAALSMGPTLDEAGSLIPSDWIATPAIKSAAGLSPFGQASPSGRSPNQIRGAYGLGPIGSSSVTFGGVQGDGSGQTIAIVDAFDYPTALGDLNVFSSYYNLPLFNSGAGSPTFSRLNQNGVAGSYPATAAPGPGSWEEEAALDIEWAHVMAPMANIVLLESVNAGTALYSAVKTARNMPGVVAVSMSWGGSETSNEPSMDTTYFTTPVGHIGGSGLAGGITFLAASGDTGAYAAGTTTIAVEYPASSSNVVSVGGTSLAINGSAWSSEAAWGNGTSSGSSAAGGGGGGGISTKETQPTYQNGIVSAKSTTRRTYPDISLEADPGAPGVPIYDSYDFGGGSGQWISGYLGGTSLACPLMAGIVAVADQGRASAGLGSLSGVSGVLTKLYQLAASPTTYAANFHDITTGNNGYAAGVGYDLATGLGSPIANQLIYSLAAVPLSITSFTASPGSVPSGTTITLSAAVAQSSGNATLSGISFYRESNGVSGLQTTGQTPDQPLGAGLISGLTGTLDVATTGLASGTYTYYAVATDSAANTARGTTTQVVTPLAPQVLSFSGTNLFVVEDADGSQLDVWLNSPQPGQGTPTQKIPLNSIAGLTFNGTPGANQLTLDFAGGDFSAGFTAPILFNASLDGANGLSVIGTFGDDVLTANGGNLLFNSASALFTPTAIGLSNVQMLMLPGGSGGNDLIDVQDGAYQVNGDTASGTPNVSVRVGSTGDVTLPGSQNLADLTINGGQARIAADGRYTLNLHTLSVTGNSVLDIANSFLYLDSDYNGGSGTAFATIQAYVNNVYNLFGVNNPNAAVLGDYQGLGGITSSLAAATYAGGAVGNISLVAYDGALQDPANPNGIAGLLLGPTAASGNGTTFPVFKTLIRPTLTGDLNGDGVVDDYDITLFSAHGLYVGDGTGPQTALAAQVGDYNGDGLVDDADITIASAAGNYLNGSN